MTRSPIDRRTLTLWLAALLVLAMGGCTSGTTSGSPSREPQPSTGCGPEPVSSPTQRPAVLQGCGTGTLSSAEVRLSLIAQLGPRWYCDPDEYPVVHGTGQERAIERWPELQAENELMRAIAARLGIDVDRPLGDADKLVIYRQWKVAASIPLEVADPSHYRFDYLAQPVAGATEGLHTAGTIDDHGTISVDQRALEAEPPCPICLSVGTLIDTPEGPIAVDRVRLGDPVWTFDRDGRRITGTVIALGSTRAPAGHRVVRLVLEDGRSVTASPGHPTADGRLLGDLRVGDVVDGSSVAGADVLAYASDETFDLVVSGPTGLYLAGGIPLGSTLAVR